MIVSSDMRFIKLDQETAHKWRGIPSQSDVFLVETDTESHDSCFNKFIRLDQKQHRNGDACRASPMCFWLSLIRLISKDTFMVFYSSSII